MKMASFNQKAHPLQQRNRKQTNKQTHTHPTIVCVCVCVCVCAWKILRSTQTHSVPEPPQILYMRREEAASRSGTHPGSAAQLIALCRICCCECGRALMPPCLVGVCMGMNIYPRTYLFSIMG